jgi:CRISPR-associated protein (TIGR02584 family)
LGTRPEVVTIALDLLLGSGVGIEQVHVVHTSVVPPQSERFATGGDRMAQSLETLRKQFLDNYYFYLGREQRPCSLRFVPLRLDGEAIYDVKTEHEARAAFDTIFNVVRGLKMDRFTVHLSIAGGRKSMSVYGMATAQLLFDSSDCLYHLFSRPEFEESSSLHAQSPDHATLVPIPVLPISTVFPGMVTLLTSKEPLRVLERKESLMAQEGYRKREEFVETWLTPGEKRQVECLLEPIVLENRSLTNSELGRKLPASPGYVADRFTRIYGKLHSYLNLPVDEVADRSVLISFLTPYYMERLRQY